MPEVIYAGLMAEGFPKMNTTVQSNTLGGRGLYDPIPQEQKDALEKQTWDFVVLQDYSETPGLPDTNANKAGSMNALHTYYHPTIRDLSKAKALFYDTWGYCCGDSTYPQYPDFLSMNSLLKVGYEEYRDLMNKGEPPAKAQSYSSHINPAGLAFLQVYQDDISKGLNPLTNGNFILLYVPLGGGSYDKHPTQFGSYLIACVHYAAVNGKSPVGLSYYPQGTPTAGPKMNTTQRDYAQNIANAVVLQNVQKLSYVYPFQLCNVTE